jgi:gamma-glutamyltranspeptidase
MRTHYSKRPFKVHWTQIGYTTMPKLRALAFADRAQYVADPDFVKAPAGDWRSLLDPAYLKVRAQLMGPTSLKQAPAGIPLGSAKKCLCTNA